MRAAYEANEEMTEEEAKAVLVRCLRVCFRLFTLSELHV